MQGVSAIVDVPVSSVALAVQDVARNRHKIVMFSGAGSSDLTGKACSPTGFAWTFDTIALANGTGSAIVKAGGDSWFFLTADYAFGTAAEHDVSDVVRANGGRVVGAVRIAMSTTDFSSFLLQAQASHAKIIGLANAGSDLINAIKQASEFGIVEAGQKLAGLLVFISDVHSLGLQTAQDCSSPKASTGIRTMRPARSPTASPHALEESARPWCKPASTAPSPTTSKPSPKPGLMMVRPLPTRSAPFPLTTS